MLLDDDNKEMPMCIKEIIETVFNKENLKIDIADRVWEVLYDAIQKDNPMRSFKGLHNPVDMRMLRFSDFSSSCGFGKEDHYISKRIDNVTKSIECQSSYPAAFVVIVGKPNGSMQMFIFNEELAVPNKVVYHGFKLAQEDHEDEVLAVGDGSFKKFLDVIGAATENKEPFIVFKAMCASTVVTVQRKFLKFFTREEKKIIEEISYIQFNFMAQVPAKVPREMSPEEAMGGVDEDDEDYDEDDMTPMNSSNTRVVVQGELPPPEVIKQMDLPNFIKKNLLMAWAQKNRDKVPEVNHPATEISKSDSADKRDRVIWCLEKGEEMLVSMGVDKKLFQASVDDITDMLHRCGIFNNMTSIQLNFGSNTDWRIGGLTEMYGDGKGGYSRFCSQYSFKKEGGKEVRIRPKIVTDFLDRDDQLIGFMKSAEDAFVSAVFMDCFINPSDPFDRKYDIIWYLFNQKITQKIEKRISLGRLEETHYGSKYISKPETPTDNSGHGDESDGK